MCGQYLTTFYIVQGVQTKAVQYLILTEYCNILLEYPAQYSLADIMSVEIDTDNGRSGLNINIISLVLIHYVFHG